MRPEDLPEKVSFDRIDYDGMHMDLAVPIEADVELTELGDVFVFNDEAGVRGSGETLGEAMEDFCGSFLLCYKILDEGGPRCNPAWEPIMRHAGGNRIREERRPFPSLRVSHNMLMVISEII